MKHYAVAIDGPSGAGKSSLARAVAGDLGFIYVDTGAIYRTVGCYVLRQGVRPSDAQAVEALLPDIEIRMGYGDDGLQRMYLNGEDVTEAIRTPEVSMCTSKVAAIPAVRAFLLEMQREIAQEQSVIMDGRDIGTVVLPDADVKIFLTASAEERAKRRFRELREQGEHKDFGVLLVEIEERDYNDSHREIAPMRPAEGAVLLDTTDLDFEQSCRSLREIIQEHMGL